MHETLRLQALDEYKILDSEAEPSYEDITHLASMICKAPVSIVSFVDKDRQWFKARRGISLRQTSLDSSICVDVTRQRRVIIVPDTTQDPRFTDSELVKGPPYIRFYAGAPLINSDGFALGALCVLDLEPRLLTADQIQGLEALARQVMNQLELRKAKLRFQNQKEKLVHSAKLDSIGEIAASIAHEINNPLAIINGNVGLLRRLIGQIETPLPKAGNYLDSIEKTVYRIDKIIRGLKALTRDGEHDPLEIADLRSTVTQTLSEMEEKLQNRGIKIRTFFEKSDMNLICRPVQIEQILTNLLRNAVDAVRELDEKWIQVTAEDEGDFLVVKITDSGCGIPAEVADKIMQPFFTTKESNRGTGLGLSISKAIAEDHGGSLELDREAKNTCFKLVLPKKTSSASR